MISDESSSDSETGRFKSSHSNKQDEQKNSSTQRESYRYSGRSRPSDNNRFRGSENNRFRASETDRMRPSENERNRRELDRRRDEKERSDRNPKERHRPSRHSPIRRYSRDRSPNRSKRSQEPQRQHRDTALASKPRQRSSSRDRKHSRSHKSTEKRPAEHSRNIKEEFKHDSAPSSLREESSQKYDRVRTRDPSSSPEFRSKLSVVKRPTTDEIPKRKCESPIDVQLDSDNGSDEVQPGSYYSLIPAVVKDKEKSVEKDISKETIISDESSEIDSSDDERLRAKLLNLEKELSKTRKKKHKKKHKKKSSKSKDRDKSTPVEVTSTTDIQEKDNPKESSDPEVVEVTSTQKSNQKESSEEGELSSEDDIDPNDLRHKLKRTAKVDTSGSTDMRDRLKSKPEVCGPALPPHLEQRFKDSESPGVEGPALPPHLKSDKNIGPSIPNEMRKVLAEREVVKYASSDEDAGIGPLPAGDQTKWTDAHERLEERALEMKIKKMDGLGLQSKDIKSREKWMLELPEAKAKILGLEARSFRAKEGPDMTDRSSWTDTPEETARKKAGLAPTPEDVSVTLQKEARAKYVTTRDDEQEKEAKKHKKKHKRDESLLEMHEKKLKKKKKKEEKEDGKLERRPFSRDTDLQANRFDEAQKKSIIKKAQALDTRFSRGEAKYL